MDDSKRLCLTDDTTPTPMPIHPILWSLKCQQHVDPRHRTMSPDHNLQCWPTTSSPCNAVALSRSCLQHSVLHFISHHLDCRPRLRRHLTVGPAQARLTLPWPAPSRRGMLTDGLWRSTDDHSQTSARANSPAARTCTETSRIPTANLARLVHPHSSPPRRCYWLNCIKSWTRICRAASIALQQPAPASFNPLVPSPDAPSFPRLSDNSTLGSSAARRNTSPARHLNSSPPLRKNSSAPISTTVPLASNTFFVPVDSLIYQRLSFRGAVALSLDAA
jgi:hypothetical protein